MKNKTNLLIDLGLLAVFLLAMEPRLTDVPLHEWLSLAMAGAVVIHLLLHWDWIAGVLLRYFKKLFHTSRLQFAVDIILFVAFNVLMVSGIVISKSILPLLGIQLPESFGWKTIHSASANATLLLLVVHTGLNWKWIVTNLKKYLLPHRRQKAVVSASPALVTVENNPADSK
jgi:hypothetical protein